MSQDIRETLKKHKEQHIELSANHASKFEHLLQEKMHAKKETRPSL